MRGGKIFKSAPSAGLKADGLIARVTGRRLIARGNRAGFGGAEERKNDTVFRRQWRINADGKFAICVRVEAVVVIRSMSGEAEVSLFEREFH